MLFYCCTPRIDTRLRKCRDELDKTLVKRVEPLAAGGTKVRLVTTRSGGMERWYGMEAFNRIFLCMPWLQCRCSRYYYASRVRVERSVVMRPVDAVEVEAEAHVVEVATAATGRTGPPCAPRAATRAAPGGTGGTA